MKPPPRRPAVYAEQNESDEERQFRKVFQQLAGDVSAVPPLARSFHTSACLPVNSCSYISESLLCRTWKWAQQSWWTSSTESSQDVGCFCALHTCLFVCSLVIHDDLHQLIQCLILQKQDKFNILLQDTHTPNHWSLRWTCFCISDADLKTDGFSIESCRSMVAVMDVSFNHSYPRTHFRTLSALSIVEFIWKTCCTVGTCVSFCRNPPAVSASN